MCRGYLVAEARKFVNEWYHLPTGEAEECRARVRELLSGDSFLYKEVQARDVSLKAWFVREELIKLLQSHIFHKDSSMRNLALGGMAARCLTNEKCLNSPLASLLRL